MANETELTIIGNLTADPEQRTTSSGKNVANLTIASSPRVFDRQNSRWMDGEPLFMQCSAWGPLADHIGASLAKGMKVIAHGRLTQRSYRTREGQERTLFEMTLDDIGPSLSRAVAAVTKAEAGK